MRSRTNAYLLVYVSALRTNLAASLTDTPYSVATFWIASVSSISASLTYVWPPPAFRSFTMGAPDSLKASKNMAMIGFSSHIGDRSVTVDANGTNLNECGMMAVSHPVSISLDVRMSSEESLVV